MKNRGTKRARTRPVRVLYACGAADAVKDCETWAATGSGHPVLSDTVTIQFLRICQKEHVDCLLLSRVPRQEIFETGNISAIHRPKRFRGKGGILYLLGELLFDFGLMFRALKFRADMMIVRECTHWFLLAIPSSLGTKIVADLHCTLWPSIREKPPSGFLTRLNAWFFKHCLYSVIAVSGRIEHQMRALTSHHCPPVFINIGKYTRSTFPDIPLRAFSERPFRVLYAGRVEEKKGIFSFLEMASRLESEQPGSFAFDICGTGPAAADLRIRIRELSLSASTAYHGHCDRDKLLGFFTACHVVVVPTTSRFPEGLARTAVEAVLCNRPVVISRNCPALDYIGDCSVGVEPDDIDGYGDAILALSSDAGDYARKARACAGAKQQFFSERDSFELIFYQLLSGLRSPQQGTADHGQK